MCLRSTTHFLFSILLCSQKLCEGESAERSQLDHDCHLEVALPPERARPDPGHGCHLLAGRQSKTRGGRYGDTECGAAVQGEAGQEWVFTVYDLDKSGKVTTQNMSSLMHSICEVVESSVKQPCDPTATTLKIKVVVSPGATAEKISQTADCGQSACRGLAGRDRSPYCVDENAERRNHYLDLAGIENYASKFDEADSCSPEARRDACSAPQRHSVATREHCGSSGPQRRVSLRARTREPGEDRTGGGGPRPTRVHGHHHPPAASPCHPASQPCHVPLLRSHSSKRLRSRAQDAGSPPSRTPCPQTQHTEGRQGGAPPWPACPLRRAPRPTGTNTTTTTSTTTTTTTTRREAARRGTGLERSERGSRGCVQILCIETTFPMVLLVSTATRV
ncbi:Protein naked cuticle 2-like [Merluccius polli]|uniref:Protein naked cuticle homolog n=1 Tax=Merluccius polli TaxID=89951 RepID=A0AA47P384_MERPO|nr:Protein naked cuticle 2-like [Merluccius polli]